MHLLVPIGNSSQAGKGDSTFPAAYAGMRVWSSARSAAQVDRQTNPRATLLKSENTLCPSFRRLVILSISAQVNLPQPRGRTEFSRDGLRSLPPAVCSPLYSLIMRRTGAAERHELVLLDCLHCGSRSTISECCRRCAPPSLSAGLSPADIHTGYARISSSRHCYGLFCFFCVE